MSKLAAGAPISKIWKRFKKIKGTGNRQPRHALVHEGRRVHDHEELAKIHAEHLYKVSSDNSYSEQFRAYKKKQETKEIKFAKDEEIKLIIMKYLQ